MENLTEFFALIDWRSLLLYGARLLLVLLIAWIAFLLVRISLGRLEQHLVTRSMEQGEVPGEARKRMETLVRLMRQAVRILLWVVVILILLRELNIEVAPLLASVGIAGLAIGFGAQNLVRDVISGFFMILENQVRVGDVATINGTGGLVEQVNFRTIVLRDLSGVVHIIPNGSITSMSNMTSEWSAYVMDIGVAYKEDPDRVMEVMRRVGVELRRDPYFKALIIDDLEVFGVDQFADSAVVIKARLKTLPIKQWEVGREFRRRLKLAFDAEAIEIPFPHRTLYFGAEESPLAEKLLRDRNGVA
ncbi:mechanosensitive ion channel family protein [Sedimenticola hydrogenitrophicus]|uniref:mechanosensitive ion channel family protein n=1 Tax=Sedimenticola hydrogenitrophicus TaxID=2967975 RepID=UPI0023AFBD4E|nr:mechanosensitive ion channel family protein [Sedimenticola hydrogenitrophicus]